MMKKPQPSDFIKGAYITPEEDEQYWKALRKYNKSRKPMTVEQIIIGTPVRYWAIVKTSGDRFNPLDTYIESEPWKLGHGEMVCKIVGVSGGVSIKHLEVI